MSLQNKHYNLITFDKSFDLYSKDTITLFNIRVQELGFHIDLLKDSRSKTIALTKLEEVAMWITKAVLEEQDERTKK